MPTTTPARKSKRSLKPAPARKPQPRREPAPKPVPQSTIDAAARKISPLANNPAVQAALSTAQARAKLMAALQLSESYAPQPRAKIDIGSRLHDVFVLGERQSDTGPMLACLPVEHATTTDTALIHWRSSEFVLWEGGNQPRSITRFIPVPITEASGESLEHIVQRVEREFQSEPAVAARAKVQRDKLTAAGIALVRQTEARRELREATDHFTTAATEMANIERAINSGKYDALCRRVLLADLIVRLRLTELAVA